MAMKTNARTRTFLFFILLAMCGQEAMAQLCINEVMQSNVDCVMDDKNQFPDSWVELKCGETAVSLMEYSIGLSPNADEAYQLPSKQVAKGATVVVYCDKENTGLHCPFRLETDKGGSLYLFRKGVIVDRLEGMEKQPAPNVSYGRRTEGSDEWGYQVTPTPGKKNCGQLAIGVLPKVAFSIPGQVTDAKETVTLSLSLEGEAPAGTIIRYTTDGSEPTANSAQYTTALTINQNRVVRAKPFCEGYLSPRSTTHSYIFHPRRVSLPVISVVSDPVYFNDAKTGILSDAVGSDGRKNYEHDWRRPINLEYFEEADEGSVLNQLCETRVQGNASRGCKIKSLAVYAHKRFGKKRFKHEFFPTQRPGSDTFKSLLLRNAGNDFDYLYMRDALIQRTMAENADIDWQAYQPAIFYLNGEYMGMLNVRERSNEDNVFSNYDGLEDIDMIENWSQLKAGTKDAMNEFKAFYNEHDHTWDEYAERMDLGEYINLMAMNVFFNNLDFPGNNIVQWRPRTEGGRWRFIAKDTDYSLGLYDDPVSFNYIEWLYNQNYDPSHTWANQSDHTRLFRRLMENEDFAREFIDRLSVYMGDFLTYDNVWRQTWGPMCEAIKEEYPSHRKLINQWWPKYDEEVAKAAAWLKQRPDYVYSYLGERFGLGTPMRLHISVDRPSLLSEDVRVLINGVPLQTAIFDGRYYGGRKLHIGLTAAAACRIASCDVITKAANGSVSQAHHVTDGAYECVMPSGSDQYLVLHLSEETDAIDDIDARDTYSEAQEYYNAQGIRTQRLTRGINLVRMGNGEVRKVIGR